MGSFQGHLELFKRLPKIHRNSNDVANKRARQLKDEIAGGSERERALAFNCQIILDRYSECSWCGGPLQTNGPCVCPYCGNVWCTRCKRTQCSACKKPLHLPFGPSIVLQTLLNNIEMPCRNRRYGCEKSLTAKNRSAHESVCNKELLPRLVNFMFLTKFLEEYDDFKCPIEYADSKTIVIDDYIGKLKGDTISTCQVAFLFQRLYFRINLSFSLDCLTISAKSIFIGRKGNVAICSCQIPPYACPCTNENAKYIAHVYFKHKDFKDNSDEILTFGMCERTLQFTGSHDEPDGALEIAVELRRSSAYKLRPVKKYT